MGRCDAGRDSLLPADETRLPSHFLFDQDRLPERSFRPFVEQGGECRTTPQTKNKDLDQLDRFCCRLTVSFLSRTCISCDTSSLDSMAFPLERTRFYPITPPVSSIG